MGIVEEKVLEAIHGVLRQNEFVFSDKQMEKADEFIIPFISDLDIDPSEFKCVPQSMPKLLYDKRVLPLTVKYFAYIEDNMTLYNTLMEDGYSFYKNHSINFYALDRVITGNFKKNEYKNLLLKYEKPISRFYATLRGLDKDKKEKISLEFSDIVHIDQTTLKVGCDRFGEISHYNFLTSNNIENFGKEFLLKTSDRQREIISDMHFNLNDSEASKIKELFNKYPNYSGVIDLSRELLDSFTIDELNYMSLKDSILFEEALKNNVVERMKNILSLDPSFDCPSSFIREEIFRVLSDPQIIELSDDAKKSISLIKIPRVDGVLVMPVKKINKIVFKDKLHKKMESIIRK